VSDVQRSLECLLGVEHLDKLVNRYLEGPPKWSFAGCLFDARALLDHDPSRHASTYPQITAEDLVAVSLLDVRFGAKAVHKLMIERTCDGVISALPPDLDLWVADDGVILKLEKALDVLDELPGVGRTKASKLLARKRPRLAPIVDSLVEEFYGSTGWSHLRALRDALKDQSLVGRINELVTQSAVHLPTTLRVLDIAIWMTRSKSTAASDAREDLLKNRAPLSKAVA